MQLSNKVGFVINYYSRPSFNPAHRTATTLCIQKLKENDYIGQVILVDGSARSDLVIREICRGEGIDYIHLDKEMTFAEGLNIGWKLLKESYVGFVANDIFPPQDTIATLLAYLKLTDVGCVFPYLSYCDYLGQMYGFVNKSVTCEPTTMTLNFNVFKRAVLEKINGVDEAYSGSYNDLIMLMKIRTLGYRVVLVGNTRVFHLGQMTISQGSAYQKDKDRARFIEEYPSFVARHGAWQVKRWKWPLATTPAVAFLWWLSQNSISTRFRNWSQALVIKFEPELTRYPVSYGKHAH